MNNNISIEIKSASKKFGKNMLFKNLNFSFSAPNKIAITGHNGSGKSTLLQTIAGVQSLSRGEINYFIEGKKISFDEISKVIGFTSPLINPYDELTAIENITFVSKKIDQKKTDTFLELFRLDKHKNKQVKYFSSGMIQRLKLILAFINDPQILLLDEPSSNLDEDGKNIFIKYINSLDNKLIFIATNEKKETNLCSEEIKIAY